jgi:hypothetical protein
VQALETIAALRCLRFDIWPQVEEQDELVQHSRLLAVLYSSDDRRDALLSVMQQARQLKGLRLAECTL